MNQHVEPQARPNSGVSRRQVLCASAAAAAAWTLPAVAKSADQANAAPTDWQMKLSTSSLHYRSLSMTEACQRIGDLGFDFIDIWSHFEWAGPLCEHLEEAVNEMGPEQFSQLLKEHNLQLGSVSCYSVPFGSFATKLGALGGCVVIRGSQHFAESTDGPADQGQLTRQMKQFLESLKPELDLAEQHNCVLAIENHSGASLLNRLDSFKAFTDLNTHSRLGIALAPYHIQYNQESVEDAILIAADQLKFFYAWQYAPEDADRRQQLPGIGPTDMRPWLKALAKIHYQGVVNPFMHHEPAPDAMDVALKKSRDYLLKACKQLAR
jgi:sugar phosphate isomerase/epimerase